VFFVLGIVLALVLPDPWDWTALGICIILGCFEVFGWSRSVRGLRVRAGAETLIGQTGRVVTPCRPDGQVSVAGELWQARCEGGADEGDSVTVVGRDGLLLTVER
jgi:membrane-bound serine protease (ClpP class)